MGLVETESLVLKSYDLAEADKIVVFLTREQGIVRGVAKGAKRLTSRFGSGLEPLSVVNATYFQKESQELVSVQKTEILRSNFAQASDPAHLQKFAYLSEILIAMSPPHDPNETLYRMVNACVTAASADTKALKSVGVYFELWLLRLAGYLPDWKTCRDCGLEIRSDGKAYLTANFHLVCAQCERSGSGRSFSAELRDIFRLAIRTSPAEFSTKTAEQDQQLSVLSNLLKQMIAQAVGREIVEERYSPEIERR